MTELRQPRRARHPVCLHRRPLGLPRGDRRRLPAGRQPDLHRAPRPPEPALPLLPRAQDAAPASCAASTPRPTPTQHSRCSTSSRRLEPTRRRAPAALEVWRRAWDRFIPFLAFPDEIRRIIYTTNTVESLHVQIRKTIKTRGHFPNDDAAIRLIWLSIQRAKTSWRSCYNWSTAMSILRIHFGDRIPD